MANYVVNYLIVQLQIHMKITILHLILTLLTFISVDRRSMTLIAGGKNSRKTLASVEVISEDASNNKIQLANLPEAIGWSPSMVKHNGTILLCGGYNNLQTCLKMEKNGWIQHSNLKRFRTFASAVATNTSTFIF